MKCLKVSLKKISPTGNLVRTVVVSMSSSHKGSSERYFGSRSSEIASL